MGNWRTKPNRKNKPEPPAPPPEDPIKVALQKWVQDTMETVPTDSPIATIEYHLLFQRLVALGFRQVGKKLLPPIGWTDDQARKTLLSVLNDPYAV